MHATQREPLAASPDSLCYPLPGAEFRGSDGDPRRRFRRLHLAGLLAILAASLWGLAGCGLWTVDDRALDSALTAARAEIDAGEPGAAIDRLGPIARRRSESVAARQLLVEACLATDAIEHRRYAEALLRELVELEPDQPRHRFALARLLLRRGFDLHARQELERLLRLAPDHPDGHLAMADYYRAEWRRYNLDRDLQAMIASVEQATRLDPASDAARRQQATNLMLAGQPAAARRSLDDLCARWPEDPRLHALRATCLAEQGLHDQAWSEFEVALDLMPAAERAPFDDLRLVADPYAVRRLRDLPPDDRDDFVRRFWKSRDPTPTTPVNERLIEHYRRVAMADALYENPRLELRGYDTARGEMYIRYGPPIATRYDHGYLTRRFVPPAWVHIYRIGDESVPVTFLDYALNGRFDLAINTTPARYDLAAYDLPETYEHRFDARWLGHAMAAAGFRHGERSTREELYLALPVDSLRGYPGDALRVEAVAFDEVWEEVARLEETVDLGRAPLGGAGGRVLVHQLDMRLPPGSYRLASMVRSGEPHTHGAAAVLSTLTEEVTVESYAAPGLGLSELELAYDVEPIAGVAAGGRFDKGGLAVIPNASGFYGDGEPLFVYFEIYGLTLAGGRGRYELSYRIRPASGDSRRLLARLASAFRRRTFIEFRVEEESAGPTVRRHLGIDVGVLKAGRYHLTLRVRDLATRAAASRTIEFERVTTTPPAAGAEPGPAG